MANFTFSAYAWENYQTKKRMISIDAGSEDGMVAVGLELTKKQAKKLVKTVQSALKEAK